MIRRYRQAAGWALNVLFGVSALIGLAGFAGPVGRLLGQGKSLEWSGIAGPFLVLLVSLVGWFSAVDARRARR